MLCWLKCTSRQSTCICKGLTIRRPSIHLVLAPALVGAKARLCGNVLRAHDV